MEPRINAFVLILIILNGLVSWKGFNDQLFFSKYKFNVGKIKAGEKLRLISSGFLHADFSHLLFNMLTLYFFADSTIYFIGEIGFLVVYFGSLFLSGVFSYYFHKNDLNYSAIGASGAVMGVLYSAILLNPDLTLAFIFIPIPIPGFVFGIGYLVYSIYGMKNKVGNIGHSAHIGGAISGFIITLIISPSVFVNNLRMVIILTIPIILIAVFRKKLK